MYSYRNIYNVSHFKFNTDTRLPRYSSSCFYSQKPGCKLKAGKQGVLYNNTVNAVIFNLDTCATVIRGQVVSGPSTPEFFLIERAPWRNEEERIVDRPSIENLKQLTTGILLIK